MTKRTPTPDPTEAERREVADQLLAHFLEPYHPRADILDLDQFGYRATVYGYHIKGLVRGANGKTRFEAIAKALKRAKAARKKRLPR